MKIFLILSFALLIRSEKTQIVEEFFGNDYPDTSGWTITQRYDENMTCNGEKVFAAFFTNSAMSKIYNLPQHQSVYIKVSEFGLDPNIQTKIYVDEQLVWPPTSQDIKNADPCTEQGIYKRNIDVGVKHSGSSAVIVITANGNDSARRWGIKNFILSIEKCPNGCQTCDYDDIFEECSSWQMFQDSWTSLYSNFMGQEGWTSSNGIFGSTNCGGIPLIGGYDKFGVNSMLTKTIQLNPHYKIKILVLWAKIDSWDKEKAQIILDGKEVWSQAYEVGEGYQGKICGNSNEDYKTLFQRINLIVDHTGNSVKIEFKTTLDQQPNDESFGLRDLQLFYVPCSDQCDECTGPLPSDCTKCKNNYYYDTDGCYKLNNFVLVESNFFEQKFTSEEGWIAEGTPNSEVISECLDKSLYGGFGVMGSGAIAYKTFNIPPHEKLRIQIYIYKIDSWDQEDLMIEVDGAEIWKRQFIVDTESNFCGAGWTDSKVYVDEIFSHSNPQATIKISSTLNQDPTDESWGFREFRLMYQMNSQIEIIQLASIKLSLIILIILFLII